MDSAIAHLDADLLEPEHLVEAAAHFVDRIEAKARKTLQSYARKIPEGSREWDVMYAKIFEEELHKAAPTRE